MKPGKLSSPLLATPFLLTVILATSFAHADTPVLRQGGLRVPQKPAPTWTGNAPMLVQPAPAKILRASGLQSRRIASRSPLPSRSPVPPRRRSSVRQASWTAQTQLAPPMNYTGDQYYEDEYYEDGGSCDGQYDGQLGDGGYYESGNYEAAMRDGCQPPGCGIGCGCDGTIDPRCLPCNPLCWLDWRRVEIFVGTQGMKGPVGSPTAMDDTGSFGFHQGINFGHPLQAIGCGELAWQLGARATQTNLSGTDFTNQSRTQIFATGGVFRRVDYGWQWGVVADYLNDQWFYDDINLLQIRSELSYKVTPNNEYGFRCMLSTQHSTVSGQIDDGAGGTTPLIDTYISTDQYRFFHRRTLPNGIQAEVNGGFSGHSDGLIGAQVSVPMTECLGLQTNVSYLLPHEGKNSGGNRYESWNVGVSLVWHPCGRVCRGRDYYRPLFDVADNGSMMIRRKQ